LIANVVLPIMQRRQFFRQSLKQKRK